MEEMNELFYREPYTKEFEAKVVSCKESKSGYAVILSDTAFYPEGGGQSCDIGTLDDEKVYDVQREDGAIVHYMKEPLETGKTVHGIIDWERRFDNMQNHTGEHIVSGLVHGQYGYDNVGFHMGKEVIQIDFNGPLDWKRLMEIEEKANAIVMKDEKVHIFFTEKDELSQYDYRSKKELSGKVRLVEIPDADLCACCGTHVARTGEIGLIKILSVTKNKGGVRVEMVSGTRAVQCVQNIVSANRTVMDLLSCRMYESADAVTRMLEENSKQSSTIHDLQEELIQYKLMNMKENEPLLTDVEEGMDRVSMVHLGNAMLKEKHAGVSCVLSREGSGYAYFICSESVQLSSLAKMLNHELSGRGGGRNDNIQGRFECDLDSIINCLKHTFGE